MKKPKFSLAVPFYNEEEIVDRVLTDLVRNLNKLKITYEIIAVDNGSTDGTGKIILKLKRRFNQIKMAVVNKNVGYGFGISTGLEFCKGEYLGFMDGDGQVPSKDLVRCLKKIISDKNVDLCKVMRKKRGDGIFRIIASFFYNSLMNLIFGMKSKDVNSKPKLFRREAYNKIKPLISRDWFIDAEILIKAKKNNLKILEIPITFKKRKEGKSSVRFSTVFEFMKNILHRKIRGFK